MTTADLYTIEKRIRDIAAENTASVSQLRAERIKTSDEGWRGILAMDSLENKINGMPVGVLRRILSAELQRLRESTGIPEDKWVWVRATVRLEELAKDSIRIADRIRDYLAGPHTSEGTFEALRSANTDIALLMSNTNKLRSLV